MNTKISARADALAASPAQLRTRTRSWRCMWDAGATGATGAVRALWRLGKLTALIAGAFGQVMIRRVREGMKLDVPFGIEERARWVHRKAARISRILGLRVIAEGATQVGGLLVANHISYLDIIVLASLRPCVFVCKSDVRKWPVIGQLVAHGGTVFVDRERRLDVHRVGDELNTLLLEGLLVVIFPEGTSSDGSSVLPFFASLLAPAASLLIPVTPAGLSYRVEGGSVARDVAYWGNMVFGSHLLRLMSLGRISARVRFGSALAHGDRRVLARELRATVQSLLREEGRPMASANARPTRYGPVDQDRELLGTLVAGS